MVVVHPSLPDDRGKVALFELQGAGHVVERDDHTAGGVCGQLVDVHDAQVRTLTAAYRRRDLLVVNIPFHGVHADVYVLLVGAELLDQLLHIRSVSAGEPVPKRKLDLRPIVRLPAATTLALHGRVVLRTTAATCQREPRSGSRAQKQEILPRQPAASRTSSVHAFLLLLNPYRASPTALDDRKPTVTAGKSRVNLNAHRVCCICFARCPLLGS